MNLNLARLSWGAVAPDVLPYYRLIRHYKDESIYFIVREISNLIHLYRYVDLSSMNRVEQDFFSYKLGIILHYLCDYTCYPHAMRQTYMDAAKTHMRYESELNLKATDHTFDTKPCHAPIDGWRLKQSIRTFIDDYVDAYLKEPASYEHDLNSALCLGQAVGTLIIEFIHVYREELSVQFI
ncbi:zinc dependent phospholipase C family protein [Peptoniphilus equinus]|uniref:Zinc dependent phospholipase C family protein n=1 Tax=Peptoniphilus equinus TaxID=3016343 RepID=A0ABY7QVE6_9FIRM|nr:zinc dependent phospholipase C family protein [Peptoniphilus equinus]WBW50767.1 zinc dependent phospholipase C family protein [Peptoniphilus equinus]